MTAFNPDDFDIADKKEIESQFAGSTEYKVPVRKTKKKGPASLET